MFVNEEGILCDERSGYQILGLYCPYFTEEEIWRHFWAEKVLPIFINILFTEEKD